MSNIAAYQEGYTDGYDRGKESGHKFIIKMLKDFYNDNYEPGAEAEFLRGYNLALDHLIELIQDIETVDELDKED